MRLLERLADAPAALAQSQAGQTVTSGAGGSSGTGAQRALSGLQNVATALGYNTSTKLTDVAAKLIATFLTLIGIIFIGMMLYAGYNWMTAMGEKEKVDRAKTTLIAAAIGLVIIISAYAITTFVFKGLNIP